jgi:hypothetical protein
VTAGVIDLDTPTPHVAVARRPLAPLLLSLLLVLSLGAAAAPARPTPATIIAATFRDETFVDGNRLYVTGPLSAGGTQSMRVYRLPAAKLLGTMSIAVPAPVSAVRQVGDTLLVTAGESRVTIAVDATSGRRLWAAAAVVVAVSGGTVLMTNDLSISSVDPRTGVTRWQIDQPTLGTRYPVSAGIDEMTSFDGQTGATLATRKIHLSGIIYTYASATRFVIGDSSGLAAYALPSLTPEWHVPADPQEDQLDPACIHVLCSSLGDSGVTVRDPATGRTIWSSSRWAAVEPLGPGLVGTTSHASLDAVRLYLLDPATGKPRTDFGGWRAVPGPDGTLRYALHPAATPHDYWFGELDPTAGTVRILGQAPQISGHCDVSAGALIYHRPDGTIAVWRFS